MTLPTLVKTYDWHGINQRITYASLNDTSAQAMYMSKAQMCTYGGWAVKWSCDGTTGPANSSDFTDRWASKANCTTRFNGSAGAQSWAVINGAYGAQILISYNGATDDIYRVGYSPGGGYALAGTSTNQPTLPADEEIISTGITMVGSTTSGDRIVHVITSTDATILRVYVYRASILQRYWFQEEIDQTGVSWTGGLTLAPASHAVVVGNSASVGYGSSATTSSTGSSLGGNGNTTGGTESQTLRVSATNVAVIGGAEMFNGFNSGATVFNVTNPELHAAQILVPLLVASTTTNLQGKIGRRQDCYFPYCNGANAQGDVFGAADWVCLSMQVVPWAGSNTAVTIA